MSSETTTVAAISTPLAEGALGVVRVTGPRALEVAARVFRPAGGRALAEVPGYGAALGRVFDAEGPIDEAVATVFRAPRSYTGEDVVELSCHGGPYLLRRALRALLDHGARPAEPGEFTRRAFLNGKLSLTQAEAVMDLISARGAQAARSALAGRDGALHRKIGEVARGLVDAAAHLAAWTDYPEEEVPEVTGGELAQALAQAAGELAALLAGFDAGRVLREGVDAAIVGRPNVGKSTLMNLLAGAQRSIVTEIPGTTRDVVEDTVTVGGVLLRLADTAGLRETDDRVESVGVGLARRRLETAELVLAVFDSSDELSDEDLRLIGALRGRPAVAVINKSDLPLRIDLDYLGRNVEHLVRVSAQNGEGVGELEAHIREALRLSHFDPGAAALANERQRACAARARDAVEEARAALGAGMTYDAVAVCIDEAVAALLELTGERAGDAIVEQVFARFCVGK